MGRFRHALKKIFSYATTNRADFVRQSALMMPPGSLVLDAGAGTCKYKDFFSHCRYKAQDFAAYEGKEHVYGNLDYVCDITDIPVDDASFDYVVCTEVLEHLPRPDLAIAEFSRILKKGGGLILTAPLGAGIHMAPYHFYGGFTPYWYEHFLGKYGFEIEKITANRGFFKLYGQESQRFLKLLTPQNATARLVFLPFKGLLAIWFRLAMPLICHVLDQMIEDTRFTVGFFVRARKV